MAALGLALAGCATTSPVASAKPSSAGPDVDVEVLAMQSRPLRVVNIPASPVKEKEEEKPKPHRTRRRRPKPASPVAKKAALPPTETFVPKRQPSVEEPPIDVPAEGDWAAALSREFKRREEAEKKRRGGEEE